MTSAPKAPKPAAVTSSSARRAAHDAARELHLGACLARTLTAAAAVARAAPAAPLPDTLSSAALALVSAAVDVATNFYGCGPAAAADLASHAPAPVGYAYASNRVHRAFYSGASTASR